MNRGGSSGNSTTIDDLGDDMLTLILFRLPSCAPIVSCKLLNKRWCFLISDPKFGSHYANHKRESTTLSKLGHNTDDDQPPWTFMAIMMDVKVPQHQYCGDEAVFGFPKLSLDFLPCNFVIEATFMDLVLCSSTLIRQGHTSYYIANPVTKQWVALPLCPRIVTDDKWHDRWVGLVCQQPYDFTQNYKFRVVVIHQCPPPVYDLQVYCSEIGEWKKLNLSVSINPELAAQKRLYNSEFQGVVCKGIIYLHHRFYFAAFNPFDVDETTDTTTTTTIEAKVLPSLSPSVGCFLRESSGQLYIIHNLNTDYYSVYYRQRGKAIEFPLMVWKLDPNQEPLIWKTTFQGLCTGNLNMNEVKPGICKVYFRGLGMHPNNDKLIYMHHFQDRDGQLLLCDTRTRLIKPLKSMPRFYVGTFDRLELQWWPSSVPKAYLSNASQ